MRSQARLQPSAAAEHGVDAYAIRLGNAEGTRDRENHNQPEQNL